MENLAFDSYLNSNFLYHAIFILFFPWVSEKNFSKAKIFTSIKYRLSGVLLDGTLFTPLRHSLALHFVVFVRFILSNKDPFILGTGHE